MALVLLADDEPNNRLVLEMQLRLARHEVVTADNGLAAIAAVRRRRPDVVLLDGMMPEMNGFAACRALRADPEYADLPVILVTALDRDKGQGEAEAAGFNRVLYKPFRTEELLAVVSEACGPVG